MPAMVDSWLRDTAYDGIVRRDPSPTRTEIHAIRDGEKLVVEIEKRGTASRLSALVDGNVEISMSARQPDVTEIDAAWQLGDLKSPGHVERLTAFLQRPENASRRVMLIGFANPQPQSPYQPLSLSQERVDYVSSELLALDVKVVSVRGFGGNRNLVDAGQPSARYRNDRVEVWLR